MLIHLCTLLHIYIYLVNFFPVRSSSHKKKKSHKKLAPTSTHPSLVLDLSFLSFVYHRAMVASLTLTPSLWGAEEGGKGNHEGRKQRVMVVGLGGGLLPTYIHKHLPQVINTWCECKVSLSIILEWLRPHSGCFWII